MKKSILYALSLASALCLAAASAHAEDTDIFSAASANGVAPNILILVDNTSSNDAAWASACPSFPNPNGSGPAIQLPKSNLLDMVYCALYGTLEQVKTNGLAGKLNIGLMVGGSGSNKGGEMSYPSASPYNLPLMDAAGIIAFQNTIIAGIPKATGNAKLDGDMTEVWAWLTGHTGPRSGTSYAAHTGSAGLSCQKTFLILIGAAAKQGRPCNGSGCGSAAELGTAGATTAQKVPITPSTLSESWLDEWTRFLYGTDFDGTTTDTQNLVTYTIAAGGTDADYTALLASAAKVGGGKAFVGTDYASMAQAFLNIFNEVASVNTVFSSVSLPISTSTQGTFDDKIYIGMFRPEAHGLQRWMGNLKQYKFNVDLSNPLKPLLYLADSNGNRAISSTGSGFISPNAVSFWNRTVDPTTKPDSLGGFWTNNKSGTPLSGFDSPDGEVVEKGGVGFRIRLDNLEDDYVANPSTPRKMYTCLGTNCVANGHLNSMPFATSNSTLTATALGINNPVYSQGVTSISRVSGTGIVTVALSGTPSPAIGDATTVTISGSSGGQFNYNLAGKTPSASGSSVTYILPQELPPTSLTTPASWTVTGAAAGLSNVSNLSRTGTKGLFTATATLADLTFGGSTTAAMGESVVIANSTGYNGTGTITFVDTIAKTIQFTMSESPSVYGGGSKLSVGSSTCTTTGNASNKNCDTFGASNTNAPNAGQANLPGLVRGTCAGCNGSPANVLMVNFSGGTSQLNKVTPALGVKAYVQSGATPAAYVNTSTGYNIVGIGASCNVTETHTDGTSRTYTGTATSGTTYYTLCLDLGASFSISPATSGNGATSSPQTTATRQGSFTRTMSLLSRGASSCNGTGSSATANNATVTVTTTAAHGFTVGEVVQVSSSSPGTNESSYVGPATVVSTPSSTQFTYTVATTPACKDTTGGMTITYQSSVGGIDSKDLIRWVRGFDNVGDEQSPGSTITVRPSVHGDVLHSRPAAVNYGTGTGVVVFYGSNDGTFRAVNGNQTGNIGTVEPGGELWSFVASEFFPKLQRLYSNSPSIHLLSTPAGLTPTPTERDYFFDGATGFYKDTVNNKIYLYLTAHRGGRIIYALDVTDPADPIFMWKFGGCPNLTDNNNCPSGAPTELGQTWSVPKAAPVKGYSNPILVFGAGYYGGYKVDASTGTGSYYGEDAEPPQSNNLMGRGIFILDAVTGTKIWQAGPGGSSNTCSGADCKLQDMTYAIPADVILLDRDRPADGIVDRAYAADVGGNVWRIDFEPTGGNAPANWQATKFAALGGATGDTTRRKLLFPPDVVFTKDFDMVVAGTGDREHPTYNNSITRGIVNRFYMMKDTQTGKDANAGSAWSPIVDDTPATTDTLVSSSILYHVDTSTTPPGAYPSTYPARGFYVTLPNAGEKFANGPSTIGGAVYFGTNTPTAADPNSCSNGTGDARGYQIDIVTGATSSIKLDGGGLPPSPVTGLVNIPLDGGGSITVPFQIGAGGPGADCVGSECKTSLAPGPVSPKIGAKRSRVYWFIDKHDNN